MPDELIGNFDGDLHGNRVSRLAGKYYLKGGLLLISYLANFSALSLKLVRLEAVRVVAEHVEVLPPEHRTNDLRILVVSHESRRERMPERVEPEPLDQFAVKVGLAFLDLEHSGSDGRGLDMIRHDHRPATWFAPHELPRREHEVVVRGVGGLGTPFLQLAAQARGAWLSRTLTALFSRPSPVRRTHTSCGCESPRDPRRLAAFFFAIFHVHTARSFGKTTL